MDFLKQCPCGSGASYSSCCAPFLQNQTTPPTAEALMRSRYTAYVNNNYPYILSSWHQSTRPSSLNLENTTQWQSLEVVQATDGTENDQEGTVEFKAKFRDQTGQGVMHEVSRFVKEDGRWFYVDGKLCQDSLPASRGKIAGKIGRNVPCPCGSGKKYKKCCAP